MHDHSPLPSDVYEKVQKWLHLPFDPGTQQKVRHLLEHDPRKLMDAFYTDLAFGTAGLRGLMGVGTNRINRYTIAMATQGLANYILKLHPQKPVKVAIAYDSRHNSDLFAGEAARVLAGNGISVLLTPELRPTPYLSFVCRHKGCAAAIMITASHNPPEYNGYKVYWSDGGQVLPPHDQGIMQEVHAITDIEAVKFSKLSDPLITYLTPVEDKAYLNTLTGLQNLPQDNKNNGHLLKIVFANLHGTGITLLPQALQMWGFTNLDYVAEQKLPDPDFPTAKNPNPELKEALALGIKKLSATHSDLLLATDPDADRVGVVILNHKEHPAVLSGNQIAAVCLYHLLETLKEHNRLTKQHAVISTIVTTRLLQTLCHAYHVHYFDTLTGFKYIGEKMREFEEHPKKYTFLFGAEESSGFLYGTHVHDKDAIITCCLLSEIALKQKREQKNLLDILDQLYEQFGMHEEQQLSIALPDEEKSHRKIAETLNALRTHPPKTLCGKKVLSIADYSTSTEINLLTKTTTLLTLPQSNVLAYTCEDNIQCIIRPSGTEPKLKIYGMIKQEIHGSIPTTQERCHTLLKTYLQTLKRDHLHL